ncbi:MAG TPA: long-chain fatty acid--CoA ligase [Acidimicrobiales bacterium]
MREYTAPNAVELDPGDNVLAALYQRAVHKPDAPALAYWEGDGYTTVSVRDFAKKVREIGAGLVGIGVQPGDTVCIFSKTRIEFTYCDYAIWAAGGITVPIYETSSSEQVKWIVGNSGAVAIIIEDDQLKKVFDEVAHELPDCQHVFVIDDSGLDELTAASRGVDPGELERRAAGITHDSVATLVYTSGTTGNPKGCAVTHGNFVWGVRQVVHEMPELFAEGTSTVMFLPLAHIFAREVQVGCVCEGVVIAYSRGIKFMLDEFKAMPPTWVFAVPRVFEKIFNTAQSKAGGGLKGKIFEHAVSTAVATSKARQAGSVSFLLKARHGLFDKLVYSKLQHTFGGKLRFAVSGGAPLGERLGHFFNGAGILVLEGYGLTETTAAATCNTPTALRIGSVGKPVPGASVAIGDDGEVLLKGGMVFRGYWRNDEATASVFNEEGWFKTGDLGSLDDEGFLFITGRKKELIITAGGKNVQPAMLEDRIRANPLVSQCLVLGDGKPFIAALVTLDGEELIGWGARHGRTFLGPEHAVMELKDSSEVIAEVQKAINDANTFVSKAEAIREFRILDGDLTIENGSLTPTLKVKRNLVLAKYEDLVKDIYGE